MLRKLICLLLVISIVCFSTMTAWGAEKKSVNITLQSAVDTAISNNSSLKLIDEKIKLAERRYNMAAATAKNAPDKLWITDSQRISNKYEELLYPLQRESELNELKWQRQNSEKQLKIDVTLLYYQILQSQRNIENQNTIISKTRAEYETAGKKVQSGIMAESMLQTYEIAIKNAEIALKGYQRDLHNQISSLNIKLGYEIDTELKLKDAELPLDGLKVNSLEDLVSRVITESHDIEKLETSKLINKTKYDILYQYSFEKPAECDTLEDSLLNIDYDIRDMKTAVELKVRQDYNNILNLKDGMSIKQMDHDQKVKLLEIAKKKYDLGMITYLEYLNAQSAVDTARVELNSAQLEYYKAVQSFKMYIDPVEL